MADTPQSPQVSIGLPVFNGEKSIAQALDSLLAQTFTDFELIISDNASTDATSLIGAEYASRDSRIKYVRQSENIGAFLNFKYVLQKAQAKYFMWAAADDYWYPEFLAKNYSVLEQNPRIVSSISKVRIGTYLDTAPQKTGTFPLRGEYSERLRQYLSMPATNSRFYGLFRRQQLLGSFIDENFYACDWAIMINALKHGEFFEWNEVLMERGYYGESSAKRLMDQLKSFHLKGPKSLFPLYEFTRWLWLNINHADFIKCLVPILNLNLWYEFILWAERVSIRKKVNGSLVFQLPWDTR
ncbi:MAG: glycosyltransferase family 2 protein [Chloroflexi bacterium]|nr:glycosyltransferase family 2 protein [Chloroflexota bacterium]